VEEKQNRRQKLFNLTQQHPVLRVGLGFSTKPLEIGFVEGLFPWTETQGTEMLFCFHLQNVLWLIKNRNS
jgi:hypothetical protein